MTKFAYGMDARPYEPSENPSLISTMMVRP